MARIRRCTGPRPRSSIRAAASAARASAAEAEARRAARSSRRTAEEEMDRRPGAAARGAREDRGGLAIHGDPAPARGPAHDLGEIRLAVGLELLAHAGTAPRAARAAGPDPSSHRRTSPSGSRTGRAWSAGRPRTAARSRRPRARRRGTPRAAAAARGSRPGRSRRRRGRRRSGRRASAGCRAWSRRRPGAARREPGRTRATSVVFPKARPARQEHVLRHLAARLRGLDREPERADRRLLPDDLVEGRRANGGGGIFRSLRPKWPDRATWIA